MPLLEQHARANTEGNGRHFSRVLGSCRKFLSAVKHAEQRAKGMQCLPSSHCQCNDHGCSTSRQPFLCMCGSLLKWHGCTFYARMYYKLDFF